MTEDLDPIIRPARAQALRASGLWRDTPMLHWFDAAVAEDPQRTAIVDARAGADERRVSYGDLDLASRRIAANLVRMGVRRGDVVAFQLPNWWQFAAMHLACLRCGAASNPLMPIFRERELAYMLDDARARVAVVPKVFRGFDHAGLLRSLRPRLPHLQHLVVIGEDGPEGFEQALLAESSVPVPGQAPGPDEVVQVLYTSGTTGRPKGVMHSSNTLMANVLPFIERLGLSGADRFFMGSPLAHQTGFLYGLWAPIVLKTSVTLLDSWDKNRAWAAIQKDRTTFTMGATPFLVDLTDAESAPPPAEVALRMFVCGGAPIPRAVAERGAERLQIKIVAVYGMTENGAMTVTPPDAPAEKVFSSDGLPLPGARLRVVDPEDRVLPTGAEGRLQIHSPSNFLGYLRRPQDYGMDDDDWFDSGDLAVLDADGYVRITGRSKDIIIRGGENIPVAEVEELLYRHPAVADAAVVAMPHPRLGETGCCFVTLRPGEHFDLPALRDYLEARGVARNYWPERVEFADALPRTASGKIQKFVLRERARSLAEQNGSAAQ
ncbi:AMP-binding protein [Algiphilus sp. W345]|uniref:AMP-binding protein n=1 Tax=Banduia mediterranea TaxID=3075609 RepID=A0ABU2WEU7_9GAMM|nr:AMP-binding protein [Algiphilus sp. W345]MDT0496387.1 AMP-binding protein [Algiphilus sp. W345]